MFDINIYNDEFFEWHLKHAREYSIRTMDWYIHTYKPISVIDFGCGIGSYLESAFNAGVKKIQGFDIGGDYAKKYTPKEIQPFIQYEDCTIEMILKDKFDCVISFETAEHIEPNGSEQFVKNICNAVSDNGLILFTAAPIGQEGCGHINCQPKEYWIDLFLKNGVVVDMYKTIFIPVKWEMLEAPKYICDNLIVFKK
jgi:cyclopropane fatty-acyl-phospholipid synthase-like methyltransferase